MADDLALKITDAALELDRLCSMNLRMERFSGLALRESSDARVLAAYTIGRAVNWYRSPRRTDKTGLAILDEVARRSASLEAVNARIKSAMIKRGGASG